MTFIPQSSRRDFLAVLASAGVSLPTNLDAHASGSKDGSRSTAMLLLTYTPRDSIDLPQYHAWLRSTDNPFFNSRPSVHYYANWRVVASKLGSASFTHFDLLEIRDLQGYDAVFADSQIVQFAKNWVRQWGQNPDAEASDQSVNYQVFLCERIAAPASANA